MKCRVIGSVVLLAVLFVNVCVAQEPAGVPEEVVKELSYLVGTWQYEGEIGGKASKGTATYRWAPNKEKQKFCLVTHWMSTPEGKSQPGISLMGWNAADKCIVETGFGSQGNLYLTHWVVKSPEQWRSESSHVIDGEKVEVRGVIVKKGPSEFVFEGESATGVVNRLVFHKNAKERGPRKSKK